MTAARVIIPIVGIVLPYVVRIPGGTAWFRQYTDSGAGGFLLLEAFNALTWGGLIALSCLIRRPSLLTIPCGLAFGYLAWAHATLDLSADAQAGIALVLIPIYSLLPVGLGGLVACVMDRRYAKGDAGG